MNIVIKGEEEISWFSYVIDYVAKGLRTMSRRGRRSWAAYVVSEALLNVVPRYSSFLRR